MFSLSFAIRQVAALLCASMLAWDYFRDPEMIGNLSFWALAVHFIYFQLPLRSRALAYLHPTSFIGACLTPVMYGFLLYWTPMLELNHMELWDVPLSTVVIRAAIINLAPLLFHTLDITSNQVNLIHSYKTKPQKIMLCWSFGSFPALGFIFELMYPESEETSDLQGISRDEFLKRNRIICFFVLLFSFTVLYLLILRRAYPSKPAQHHSQNNIQSGSNNGSNQNSPNSNHNEHSQHGSQHEHEN